MPRDYFGQCPNTQVSGQRFGHLPHAAAIAPLVTNSESQHALRRTYKGKVIQSQNVQVIFK